ncbi:hypothetical protein [Pseudovibrio sp. Alg231-02]|uniref:hypothetical protein n=1 Tax=Pseudovibrio sp. Alg231-02 TaxID=1922223 RepID=UPI00131EFEAA|nr:hypothetical protein [Pseudovibrio sp. Alg231-02]
MIVAFFPSNNVDLAKYYLFWILLFMFINIVWDFFSKATDKFTIGALKTKHDTLYAAATFASSLLLLISVFEPSVKVVMGTTHIPIILAGCSGLLQTISALCPYDARRARQEPSPA